MRPVGYWDSSSAVEVSVGPSTSNCSGDRVDCVLCLSCSIDCVSSLDEDIVGVSVKVCDILEVFGRSHNSCVLRGYLRASSDNKGLEQVLDRSGNYTDQVGQNRAAYLDTCI